MSRTYIWALSLGAMAGCVGAPPPVALIPPDAGHATQALVDSARHGEWVDVPVAAGGAPVRSWLSYPERRDPAPIVIVVHEIFGLTDWVRSVADRLAGEGFVAIAPDLLSGKGPGGGGSASFEGDAVRAAIRALAPAEVADRLNAVRSHALSLPSTVEATGCIGFCWGGRTTFAYATAQAQLQAAVVWYGTAPGEEEALARVACPVLGLYGGDDARVTSTVAATSQMMRALGKAYTPRVYDGAGHGFLRQQTARDGANLSAARRAWPEAIAFLRACLEQDRP